MEKAVESVESIGRQFQEESRVTKILVSRLTQDVLRQQTVLDGPKILHRFNTSIKEIKEVNQRTIERFIQGMEQCRREELVALEMMAEIGWYIDPEMPPWTASTKCANALREGNKNKVVEAITEYYQQQAESIELKLKSSYRHREQVLHDAFNAHREGKYNLSIPVFLAQADGMWWEKFNTNLSSREGRCAGIQRVMSQVKVDYFSTISLLLKPIPLFKSKSERDITFDELNRHQILHGEVFNYGTEQNSIKMISFLSYLCGVLDYPNDEAT